MTVDNIFRRLRGAFVLEPPLGSGSSVASPGEPSPLS